MKLKIKRLHPEAQIPQYQTSGAIAFDLHALLRDYTSIRVRHDAPIIFDTGIAVEVPEGYGLFVFPRSGLGYKYDVQLANGTGLIDQDYRGSISVKLSCLTTYGGFTVHHGDRIAQAVVMPIVRVEFEEVSELEATERGANGRGSTGV